MQFHKYYCFAHHYSQHPLIVKKKSIEQNWGITLHPPPPHPPREKENKCQSCVLSHLLRVMPITMTDIPEKMASMYCRNSILRSHRETASVSKLKCCLLVKDNTHVNVNFALWERRIMGANPCFVLVTYFMKF